MKKLLGNLFAFVSERIFLPYGDKPFVRFLFKLAFLFSVPPKELFKFAKVRQLVKVKPYTLLTFPRLSRLYDLAQVVENKKITGDFVECGVCNGGSAGLVANIFKPNKTRQIWLFDSWEGMPTPDSLDTDSEGELGKKGIAMGYQEKVEKLLYSVLKCEKERIHIVKGLFQNTLPSNRSSMGPISLLHLDCDWYESIKICLELLYNKVVEGGFVVIDDYGYWQGCRKAVDEFFQTNRLTQKIIPIDYSGVYFQK